MNAAHLHLLFNHAPVFSVLVALALFGIARVRRSDELARFSLWVLVASGIAAAAAIITGEPAEHAVEHLAGISERAIEAHEEAAELAALGTYSAALIALVTIVLRRRIVLARYLTVLAMVAALGAFGLMARTANLGGRIRHPEILGLGQVGGSQARSPGSVPVSAQPHRDRDED